VDKTFATRYPVPMNKACPLKPTLKPEAPGTALLRDATTHQWLLFKQPSSILHANQVHEVIPLMEELDCAAKNGLHAAGFITYEAAPAFDPAFCTLKRNPAIPYAWFGLYKKADPISLPDFSRANDSGVHFDWQPGVTRDDYRSAIERIHAYIRAGDTYQVNYTFRLRAQLNENPWALFLRLQHAQRAPYGAFLNTGDVIICSASPELFFSLEGSRIICRPMKGTAPRGCRPEDDMALGETLRRSRKNRAENVMIVDMVRNDLGRIADSGSVEVASLFDVQQFPTVWQMTSTVRAETTAPMPEIMSALFPCASITGAPKIRTMEIITELETSPRGIYTGCIGFVAPNRRAQFSVAIRTVQIAVNTGVAEYGTGGGIVWDSTVDGEYEECLTKTAILREQHRPFQLLETMLWQPGEGILFNELHLERLVKTARYFSFPVDEEAVRSRLDNETSRFTQSPMRMRLLVAEDGTTTVESAPAGGRFCRSPGECGMNPWRVALAPDFVSSSNRFLYHKTTRREMYDDAKRSRPDTDDVILRNERGEITESCIANVVARIEGKFFTPPISCGLLGGVFRAHLLERGEIHERILSESDLRDAEALFLINSVRGWIPCTLT